MLLNEMKDNEGARKRRMRVGRGIGSGKGKTCGRGYKGQKSREGVSINGFEGGQMPIHRRLPKRGFDNVSRENLAELNLGELQRLVDAGTIDAKKDITVESLREAGVIRPVEHGVKLLGNGELKAKVKLTVTRASASAKAAVEKAGGSVTITAPVKEAKAA